MKNPPLKFFHPSALRKYSLVVLLAMNAGSLRAEDVFVTSYRGATSGETAYCPPSCFTGSVSSSGSTASSSANPVPVIPASGRRTRFGFATGATWAVTPTDIDMGPNSGTPVYHFSALQHFGESSVYKIYVTKGNQSSASTDILVDMTLGAGEGSLADVNGNGATSVSINAWQRSQPMNTWIHVGYITNLIASPTITFTANGTIDSGNRWYTDAVRFEYIDICTGVAPQVGVAGPVAQGQTYVNVTGVSAGATNVTAYVNSSPIGETNFSGGFAAGTVLVPTTALNKGDVVTARQTKNGCTSDAVGSGPTTGGGPNAQVKAFLSCWKNAAFTGPIGASATNGLTLSYTLQSSGLVSGSQSAPKDGVPLTPSQCWQTVTFDAIAPGIDPNAAAIINNTDPFCALEGLVFALDESTPDTGPYNIYVDQIMNGDVVIEDFESYSAGTTNTLMTPRSAPQPIAANAYLSAPNSSIISTDNAFSGTKSCQIQWQWANESNVRWTHIQANAPTGKRYPQLDTSKPITVRYLVLPVGATTNKLAFPTATTNQTVAVGANVVLNAGAAGEGPFTYQWSYAGSDISGATGNTYTKNNIQEADAGAYSVFVTGASCNATNTVTLAVSAIVSPVPITYTVDTANDQVTLSWTGTGFVLQSTTSLTTPVNWVDVPSNPSSPYIVGTSSGTSYFRLRHP